MEVGFLEGIETNGDPSGGFLLSETRPTRVIATLSASGKDESFRRRVLRGISSL